MKPRLIILSDIWGFKDCNWIQKYTKHFSEIFEVILYDCCVLGNVITLNQSEESIHKQFISKGIENAVNELIKLETEIVNVLAFSIGGTIAWNANLKGLKVKKFTSISSTRLRYEIEKPSSEIKLYYGENDFYKPTSDWFEKMNVNFDVLKGKDHQVYKDFDNFNFV